MALHRYQSADIAHWRKSRPQEERLADKLLFLSAELPLADALSAIRQQHCKVALLGIPEDIGPRANLGLGGADQGWSAFLSVWLNLQANAFSQPIGPVLLAGHVECADLQQQASKLDVSQPEQLQQLRALCNELDQQVEAVMAQLFQAGFYVIVIGGGHNNAYPLIKALATATEQAVHCANLDPHSDFRPLEGRHSGNGFSYAWQQQLLANYFVLGLHELKNSQASLTQLQQAGAEFVSLQALFTRQQISWQEALDRCIDFVADSTGAIGIELDTDSIELMPASAFTSTGLSVHQATQYVYQLALLPRSRYLHLAEAAPARHPAGQDAGMQHCGQVLAALCDAFMQAKAVVADSHADAAID
ncbi:MAG: formimidoylglutamase [Alkalimonas sp.]|nr:formimidoylglutamase [Alkalimonas sp.]